jgi:hypothetical protein
MFDAKLVGVVLAAAGLIGVAGCGGGSGGSAGMAELTLQLVEQNSSGQDGRATFTSLDGGRTRVVLELTNPPNVAQPAHLHSGTCDDLGDPVFALTSVEDGTSETEVESSLEELEQGDLVIHAHKSDAEYDVSVACAPVERG